MNKSLLIVSAAIEVITGIALLTAPSAIVTLLVGGSLDSPSALVLGRIAGAAVLSLGFACWLARNDGQSRATRGLIAAMLLYNVAVVALLAHAGLGSWLAGVGLWPAVVLHAVLTGWCIACLRPRP